jgi:small subunit ribosomal protein S17
MDTTTQDRKARKTHIGDVVGNRMQKSVLVRLERVVQHPKYLKVMRHHTVCMAHDEKSECRVGDKVRIIETRPLSKRKRWRVTEIVGKSQVVSSSDEKGSPA